MAPEDDVRRRLAHVVASLHPLTVTPITHWRAVWLEVTLAVHELEIVLSVIRRQMP
jgi:hypothetical protein